jgi:photosystem II stability/assembly factor-like uncharacterized protein
MTGGVEMGYKVLFAVAVIALLVLVLAGLSGSATPQQTKSIQILEVRVRDLEPHLNELILAREEGKIKVAAWVGDHGILYADDRGGEVLSRLGVTYDVLIEDISDTEVYLITKSIGIERGQVEQYSKVLSERDFYFLVCADPYDIHRLYLLPAKVKLPALSGRGLPFLFARPAPEAYIPQTLSYSLAIQTMVDSVSESRLYSYLSDLSGENEVTVGGETYVISTRYSRSPMALIAATFLKEQFESLGIDSEFDYTGLLSALKAVDFPLDNICGWAVGADGAIIHTENGGDLWTEQRLGEDVNYNSISMLNASRGVVVGEGAAILTTTDGHTWVEVASPTSENLKAVVLVDSLTGYSCGNTGTILKTNDGGGTWDSLPSGTSSALKGIYFADQTEGWAVGAGGLILHTTDAGSTWVSVASPVTSTLNSICGLGNNLAWICGSDGTVLLTQDGSTWQEVSTPTVSSLLSIFFANATTGWTCGRNGALLVTTDGGFTWSDISFGGANFWDICLADENEGWLAGYVPVGTQEAVLLHTTSGGAIWTDQSHGVASGYRNVVATMPGTSSPDEIYIICGHYDSVSEDYLNYAPGADDNGTGTIATLEAARVLSDYRFEATLKFVCFAAEEQGLLGSRAYADRAYERGDSIVAAVNFDMIGYADAIPEDLEIIYDTPSTWLADRMEAVAAMYVPDLAVRTFYDPYTSSSDHLSFWQYGYVSVLGAEDRQLSNPHFHSTTDRVSTLDFNFYTNVVKSGTAVLAEMARLDTVLSSVKIVGEPNYWRIAPNPCRAGAEIVMAARGAGPIEIEFYDVRGRLVSKIMPQPIGGDLRVFWEAKDLSGNPLGPGVYFVRSVPEHRVTKIVLLR